jgi:hypothetical protein
MKSFVIPTVMTRVSVSLTADVQRVVYARMNAAIPLAGHPRAAAAKMGKQ